MKDYHRAKHNYNGPTDDDRPTDDSCDRPRTKKTQGAKKYTMGLKLRKNPKYQTIHTEMHLIAYII